jgi:MFS family permease
MFSTHPFAALIYIALFGAGAGTQTIMRAALIAEEYGSVNYGVISGIQNIILTVARTVAPIVTGLLVERIGYNGMVCSLIGLLAVGVLALFMVEKRNVAQV